MPDKKKARIIAFYLPQFHPIKENNEFWGTGFTEWTNVAKAKPLFKGHYQPQIPSDLGFYDLRIQEIGEAQAKMAMECGVEGFCYWNYWFGAGKKVLDMPLKMILENKSPEFPFCLGWANHDWTNNTWEKTGRYKKEKILIKQNYFGIDDYTAYFYDLLPAFKDKRYITVDGKSLFYVYDPTSIPNNKEFIALWNRLSIKNGLNGIYFICRVDPVDNLKVINHKDYLNEGKKRYEMYIKFGYNAINSNSYKRAEILTDGFLKLLINAVRRKLFGYAINKHDYLSIMRNFYMEEDKLEYVYPQITPRKDKTPRAGKKAMIYHNSTPEKFRIAIKMALKCVENKPEEHKIIFLNSWNEWGEGSYMEPDIVFGHEYLNVLKEEICEKV